MSSFLKPFVAIIIFVITINLPPNLSVSSHLPLNLTLRLCLQVCFWRGREGKRSLLRCNPRLGVYQKGGVGFKDFNKPSKIPSYPFFIVPPIWGFCRKINTFIHFQNLPISFPGHFSSHDTLTFRFVFRVGP